MDESNPYIRLLKKIQAQQGSSISSIQTESLEDYDLGGVDCPVCGNTGSIPYQKDGFLYSRECECMSRRRMIKAVKRSGMEDMLKRYTFDAYVPYNDKTAEIKRQATEFAARSDGWYYISGRPGSGKSHICTAICNALIERGKAVRYMLWRDDITKLKSMVNEDSYADEIGKLKKVPVLYIDDFLKGNYTEADIRIALSF